MKVTCASSALLEVAKLLAPMADASRLLLQTRGERLMVAATDHDRSAVLHLPADVDEPGSSLVEPELLSPPLERARRGRMFLHDAGRGRLTLDAGDGLAHLETGTPETFPRLDAAPRNGYLRLKVDDALRAGSLLGPLRFERFEFLQFTRASDTTINVAGTDEWILTHTQVPAVMPDDFDTWYLPPECLEFVPGLARLAELPADQPVIGFKVDHPWGWLVTPAGFLRVLLPYAHSAIPYASVLADGYTTTIRVKGRDLVWNLKAAAAVSDATVTLQADDDVLRVRGRSVLKGSCDYRVDATVEGDGPLKVTLEVQPLLRCAGAMVGEMLELRAGGRYLQLVDDEKTAVVFPEATGAAPSGTTRA